MVGCSAWQRGWRGVEMRMWQPVVRPLTPGRRLVVLPRWVKASVPSSTRGDFRGVGDRTHSKNAPRPESQGCRCAATTYAMILFVLGFLSRRARFPREFFMPRCGATFDENSVPPWTRGDFRGVWAVTDNLVWVVDPETHPGASCHPSEGGDLRGDQHGTV